MPSKSLSHAKALLVLCLLSASISVYFGKQWSNDARALKGSLAKMNKEAANAKASLDLLKEKLQPDASTLPLDQAVSAALLDVFNLRVANGIAISSIAPGKQGGGTDMRQITALAEDVPGTSLKSVKVNIDGNYKTYPGLMNYLTKLQRGPLAVTRLRVQDHAFDMSLRIYGSMETR